MSQLTKAIADGQISKAFADAFPALAEMDAKIYSSLYVYTSDTPVRVNVYDRDVFMSSHGDYAFGANHWNSIYAFGDDVTANIFDANHVFISADNVDANMFYVDEANIHADTINVSAYGGGDFDLNGYEVSFTGFGRQGFDLDVNAYDNFTIFGGSGNDYITTDGGADGFVSLGNGNDVYISDSEFGDRITALGDNGNDVLIGGDGNETFIGGNGNDFLFGNSGADNLYGGNGNDVLIGGSGNDQLYGNDGDDYIRPGDGFDIIDGGNGNDTIAFDSNDGYNFVNRFDYGDELMFNGSADDIGNISITNTGYGIDINFGDTFVHVNSDVVFTQFIPDDGMMMG